MKLLHLTFITLLVAILTIQPAPQVTQAQFEDIRGQPGVMVTTLVGGTDGNVDGSFEEARFKAPYSVAVSSDGRFALVIDDNVGTVRRLDLVAGVVSTIANLSNQPKGIDISPDDSFALIVDQNGIQRLDLTTNNVTTVSSSLPFLSEDINITNDGNTAYVLNDPLSSNGSSFYEVNLATGQTTLLASNFGSSLGFALSPDESFIVLTEWGSGSILRLDTASGVTTIIAGGNRYIGAVDGIGTAAGFSQPRGVTISADGSYALITDAFQAGAIRRLDLTTNEVTTIAGSTSSLGLIDGPGDTAGFDWPEDIALSADGSFALVTESRDGRSIRLLSFGVAVGTRAGGTQGSVDGKGAAAEFNIPGAVAYLPNGNAALIADGNNHTIRRLNLVDNSTTTIAGTPGQTGNQDGVGAAARFDTPLQQLRSAPMAPSL